LGSGFLGSCGLGFSGSLTGCLEGSSFLGSSFLVSSVYGFLFLWFFLFLVLLLVLFLEQLIRGANGERNALLERIW